MNTNPSPAVLVIACGALAHEIVDLCRAGGWSHIKVQCLPAKLHNRPERIPEAVRREIRAGYARGHRHVFLAYGDCGTGGLLDKVIEEERAAHSDLSLGRLPGAHCYEFYAGSEAFHALAEEEPGTFYLTDFLVRHFERLMIQGLGLDKHPQLMPLYFGNYRRVVYLSQTARPELVEQARAHAARISLAFEHRPTAYGVLGTALGRIAVRPAEVSRWHG